MKDPSLKTATNTFWDAEAVFSSEISRVNERLSYTRHYSEMIPIVENFLLYLINRARYRYLRPIDNVSRFIVQNRTTVSLVWLADQACLSPRQFYRQFMEREGVSPKLYTRIARFENAMKLKSAHPSLDWLSVAIDLAYYDYQHITDIVNVFRFEDLHDVILVGHSYGGMVISGVAEQIPDRINRLIYLDAFVPSNGESLFTSRGPNGDAMTNPHTKDGFVNYFFGPIRPTPPTDVPQPVKTFTEPLLITNPAVPKIPTSYILMTQNNDAEKAGFAPFAARAKQRNW